MYQLARRKDDPQAHQAMSWEDIEAEAHTLLYWQLSVLPGIVQTEDYARGLFGTWRHSPEKLEELTARRMGRQSLLTRLNPPDVIIIFWEHALCTPVSSPEVMAAQLERLLELSSLAHVYIHVVPSAVRPGMGAAVPISLASTGTGDVVQAENPFESGVLAEPLQVQLAHTIFNNVRSFAKDEAESRAIITEAMESWKSAASSGASPATAAATRATASS